MTKKPQSSTYVLTVVGIRLFAFTLALRVTFLSMPGWLRVAVIVGAAFFLYRLLIAIWNLWTRSRRSRRNREGGKALR